MVSKQSLSAVPEGAEEIRLKLPHLELAALAWGDPEGKPLLALHGWLDNAMTFVKLAPALAAAGYRVVALDFAGHGFSAWRPAGQTYLLLDNCFDVQAAAMALGWKSFTLIGHSMGAGVASLLAGAHPSVVEKLLLIDGIGTLTTADKDAASQLSQAMARWIGHQKRSRNQDDKDAVSAFSGKIYPSIDLAAKARMLGVGAVDYPAALQLCQRALQAVDPSDAATGWFWRSDSRLRHPSPFRLTEAQNLSFMTAIKAPTLYLEADQGLMVKRPEIATRLQAIENAQKLSLTGGHHLHLEETSCEAVTAEVIQFLS
ncbi:alpha/beta fold hydrolase [Marinospirillum insulare]|uniref:Hydrolase n=1 Tax=Marinospirillum insulare TaxID=217169 RepID=A0ABQ6A2Y8_9GAMM|nr:alpha/beta hydrolase [Marinospirillum insulare]GLR64445.1 hydrolase [Marinospirillum insulare]